MPDYCSVECQNRGDVPFAKSSYLPDNRDVGLDHGSPSVRTVPQSRQLRINAWASDSGSLIRQVLDQRVSRLRRIRDKKPRETQKRGPPARVTNLRG
jgi:hypothetical protein